MILQNKTLKSIIVMSIPNIVKKLEKSRNILLDIEKIEDNFGNKFIDLFKIDNFSYWELSKPIINLHIIPAIESKSFTYNLPSLIFRLIKRYISKKNFTEKKDNKNINKIDIIFLGFSDYINNDIFEPFIEFLNNQVDQRKLLLVKDSFPVKTTNTNCEKANVFSNTYQGFNNDINKNINKIVKNRDLFKFYFQNKNKFHKIKELNIYQIFKIFFWIKYIFIPKYIPYVLISDKIIQSNSPKCIIESDIADPKNRAFILNAKKYNISTFTLQFAFYNRDSYEWHYLISDKVFIWGDWFLNLFENYFQVDKEKIIQTGSPRFDKLSKLSNNENYIINNNDILIISSYEIKAYKKITKTINFKNYISELIEKLIKNGFNVYIKIHPLEKNINYLKKYIGNGLEIVDIEHFHSILNKVSFIITHGSTLTFDALLMNKIICYPSSKEIVWWDDIFLQNNLGLDFNNSQDLINNLYKICDYGKYQNNIGVKDFIMYDIKKSSSRIIYDYLLKYNYL